MRAMLQVENILVHISSPDAAVHLYLHEVAQGQAHPLRLLGQFSCRREYQHLRLPYGQFESVERAKREDARLARATLTLHDYVAALNDGQNGSLLHGGGLIEAIGVEAAEEGFRDAQLVKAIHDFELLGCLDD